MCYCMLSGLFRRAGGRSNGRKRCGPISQDDGSGKGTGDCKSDRTLAPLYGEDGIGTVGDRMVPEVMNESGSDCTVPMLNGRPDVNRMIMDSRMELGLICINDFKRVSRYIMKKCSNGGQLTHEQFVRYYLVVRILCVNGLISTMFDINCNERIRVTRKGLEYLSSLERQLGVDQDCMVDGEPLLNTHELHFA